MNKPIISPMLLYLVSITNGLNLSLFILVFFSLIATLVFGIIYIIECAEGDEEFPPFEFVKNALKKSTIFLSFSILGLTFIPSESTCYKMIVANYITPNNIKIVQDEGKNALDYIINSVDKLLEEEK